MKFEMKYKQHVIADEIIGLIHNASKNPDDIEAIVKSAWVKLDYLVATAELDQAREDLNNWVNSPIK